MTTQHSNRYIDVHHHLLPDFYIEAVGVKAITGQAPKYAKVALDWTPAHSLDVMDANGVDLSMLSISAPGLGSHPQAVATLSRRCNHYLKELTLRHPGRFGAFATLPLPEVQASLEEIRYCHEQLGLRTFGILSNHQGRYFGDPEFQPLVQELDRIGAVVFVHPTLPEACRPLLPSIPASIMEFPLDTTRCVMSLLYGGVFLNAPGIRFVFSHGGGTVPYLCNRMARLEADADFREKTGGRALELLQRQFYDTALCAYPQALATLDQFVPVSQILYGSDFPFAPGMMEKSCVALEAWYTDRNRLDAVAHANSARLLAGLV